MRPGDVNQHVQWQAGLNTRLNTGGNPGSNYFIEFGFNGNGNLLYCQSVNVLASICPDPINYIGDQIETTLEYIKPLGTGLDLWPANTTFDWIPSCIKADPLAVLWTTPAVRDVFGLLSHTFTHLQEDPITYADAYREISYNQKYASVMGLDQAKIWSPKGLIPPAITGLHNGDALQAWTDLGLTSCVGDNTRPVIRNPYNDHWPLITNVSENGFAGFQVTPRFASRIYYNWYVMLTN